MSHTRWGLRSSGSEIENIRKGDEHSGALPPPLRGGGAAHKGNKNAIGHIPSNRKAVSIYTLENVFVQSFNSLTEAAEFIGVSKKTVSQAMKRGYIIKGQHQVRHYAA